MKTLLLFAVLLCLGTGLHGASVGPTGYFTNFSAPPAVTDWSTRSISGSAGESTNAFMVDTNVQAIAASSITNQVLNFDPTNPPAANVLAAWTSGGGAYLLTQPTGNRMTLLMATLVNNTGTNVANVHLSYNLTVAVAATEEVPGQRVYYSLTGAAGSWVNIAAPTASGLVDVNIATTWLNGNLLYILIADDNGSSTDNANEIDNFSVTTSGGSTGNAILITSPTDGQSIVEQANFAANALISGSISTAAFYLDGVLVGSDGTAPYSVTYSNLALGPHVLTAVGNSSVTSAPVHVTIVANHPPSVALATVPGTNVLVGSNIVNTATITDLDPGGSIQRVEFYLDGVLKVTDTTSPYTYELCDVLAGTHTITAIAVDQSNARGTNANTLTATNPVDAAIIIPNGSNWRYLDKGVDPGVAWTSLAFNDSGWSNGLAELGYGDASNNNRPETTVLGYGSNANLKYPTTWFRKSFTVASPSTFTNLIVRLLRDDGGIVYLNGVEVFRSAITNAVVTSSTYTPPAVVDDGTFYQVTNVANTLVAGTNLLAVEMHQDATNSTDISFDLMLWGQPAWPRLKLARTNGVAGDLSWPAPSAGFVLKFKTNLNQVTWGQDVSVPAAGADGAWHVGVDVSGGQRFYRLEHPGN